MKYDSLIVVTNRQRIGQELKLNGNVGKSEYNDEWNTAIELRLESHSRKNRENVCLQPDFCSWMTSSMSVEASLMALTHSLDSD